MKCVECPFHKVISDPDPTDWFNRDDEAIICLKFPVEPNNTTEYLSDKASFRRVDVGLRPYQTKNVEEPSWCPISLARQRDKKLNTILDER